MTSTLRTRVAALCGIVALLTAALGLWSSSRILMRELEAHIRDHAREALLAVTHTERRLAERLAYEVGDYARWDDLYEQLPLPTAEWARINLSPGSFRGAINRGMAIFHEGRLLACYATGQQPTHATDSKIWLTNADLALAPAGMALVDGRVLLQANDAIVRSDLSGPPRGRLVAFREMDADLIEQLTPNGWRLSVTPAERGMALTSPVVTGGPDHVSITEVRAVPGGAIRVSLRALDNLTDELRRPVIHGSIAAGLLGVLLATLLGMLLGWHWMDPLRRLARACQRRVENEDVILPDGHGLLETESLAENVRRLVAGERQARTELQSALAHMRTAHAVHSRYSERLVVDLTEPLRRIGTLIDTARNGQAIDAGALFEAQEALTRIGDRVADGAVLGQDFRAGRPGPVLLDLAAWLSTVVLAMQTLAATRQVRIETVCHSSEAYLEVRQLMPLVVHLLSNAVRAAPAQSAVQVRVECQGGYLRLEVHDRGPGFPPEILERVKAACARGEVFPGEPGIGFGLSLVIERSVQLGGYLTIPTSTEQGTVVCLTLPSPSPPVKA